MCRSVYIFIVILSVFSCLSCKNGKSGIAVSPIQSNRSLEEINIDNAKKVDKIFFSTYFNSPSVVVLETNEQCIIQNIRAIDHFNNKYYILDDKSNALYVFSDEGSFIRHIGSIGSGHGEYIEISDFSIDRDKKELYLWDEALDVALKYDVDTGEYLSSIHTERNGERSFCMQYYNGHLYVNKTSADENGDHYLLKEIDMESGLQRSAYLNAADYNRGWNYPIRLSCSFFYSKNCSVPKYIEMFSDTIVAITEEGIVPQYVVKSRDFITCEDIAQLKKTSPDYIDIDMRLLTKLRRIFCISRYADLKDGVTFEFMHGEDKFYLVYDKNNGTSIVSSEFVNDYISKEMFVPTNICYSDEQGVLTYILPNHMSYFVEHFVREGRLNQNIENFDKLSHLNDDSNPVLFYHKYRKQ